MIALRSATLDDHAALEALQRRASLALPEYRAQLLAHPDVIELARDPLAAGRVPLAEACGVALGFAVWLPLGTATAELDGLFVDPDHWLCGIGRMLADTVAGAAAAAGMAYLHVVANPGAVGFYLRCGFQRTGETSTRFGPAVTMIRDLPGARKVG